MDRVIVLENDIQSTCDWVENQNLPGLHYRFFPKANKSAALNNLLPELAGSYVIFLDDDVTIAPGLFATYCDAFRTATTADSIESQARVTFWGGSVSPDFEEAPPQWLVRYLPRSVAGWTLGDTERICKEPNFLGCNWAANADSLIEVGGFDEQRGPGIHTATMGQEASAQQRLLAAGYVGLFLPGQPVMHFIPKDRCSPEWALDRVERNGKGFGMRYAARYGQWIWWLAKARLAIAKWRCPNIVNLCDQRDFARVYNLRRWQGFVDGSKTNKA